MYVKNYVSDSTEKKKSLKATHDMHIRRMDSAPMDTYSHRSEVFRASKLLNEEYRQSGDKHTRIFELK